MDLNQRPLGYEPNELPGCSIPRCNMTNILAEKEGFEPPRRRRPPGFQDRSLQPDLGISPKMCLTRRIITHYQYVVNKYYDKIINLTHYIEKGLKFKVC